MDFIYFLFELNHKKKGKIMLSSFTVALEQRDWLLADGAVGTNLFEMGLSNGDAPEI